MAGYDYDPESLGARCSECILKRVRVGGPVAPEIHHNAQAVVIAETPGEKECELGRPLVGPGGMEFTESIQSIGVSRRSLTILQALPCQPPENDLDKVLHKLQRENKKRIERGEEPLPHPVDACRPRLMVELDKDKHIITLGKMAFKAVTGSNASILEMRGGPVEGRFTQMGDFEYRPAQMLSGGQSADPNFPVKILPTLHPGFVIRAKRWKASFKSDLARAFRFFKDQLNWVEPWMVFNPDPDTLEEWLWKHDMYAYDTETTIEDSTVANLKCISIATEEGGVAVAFYSIESGTAFYSDADLHRIKEILRRWFTDENIMKVAHNHFGFDIQIIKNHFKVEPTPVMDTIMLHRLVASELPHRLGFVGSIYTDVSSWKAAHTAKTAASDNELLTYAVLDVAVTSRILMPMLDEIRLRGQSHLISKDHKIAGMCSGMKEMGMWVDMSRRKKEAIRVQAEILKYRDLAIAAAGKSVNLNSVYQLRSLLFEEWNIEPSDYTKMGDPSTSDDAMRLMRTQNRDNKQLVAFIDSLRKYRRAAKEYGTYIARAVPYGQSVGQIDLPQIYDEESNEEAEDPRGLIMPDGRMHPNYNAFGTTSGRLSSSNPNCFTGDTEILTEKGWIRFDQLPQDVKVAQYHHNKKVTFTYPTAYIEEDFDGELIHVQNQHINLLTTPDHRCLLRNRKTDELRVFQAKDYPEDWQQLHAGIYEGGPGLDVSDDVLRFIIAVQADGSWVKGTRRHRVEFGFSKSRKIESMKDLFTKLGDQIVVRTDRITNKGQKHWGVEGSAVDTVFSYIGQSKHFGDWMLKMSRHQIDLVLEEIWNWDGCFTRKNHYSSNEKINVDWIQTLMALSGYRGHSREYQGTKSINHQVDITRRDYSMTTNRSLAHIPYNGKVYCVSVPSSYILVRLGGEVMVTGQSQNFPKHLRGMVRAQPGRVYVGADADQLELRIITAIAQIPIYLEAFAKDEDPHSHTAAMMFKEAFTKLEKKSKQWKELRTLAKGIKYASFYGSGDETVHGIVTSAEDDKGELIYPNLSVADIAKIRRNWLKSIPQLPKWWDDCLNEYRTNGFVLDPVWGRRRDFLDGEKFNEIVNFPAQSAGAHIIHDSTFDLLDAIPFGKWGHGTGLINQCHDAVVFEVPMDHEEFRPLDAKGQPDESQREFKWCPPNCTCTANKVARLIKEAMNRSIPGLDGVTFSATPEIGLYWNEV